MTLPWTTLNSGGPDPHDDDVLRRAERDRDQEPDHARDELADIRDEPAEERQDRHRKRQGQPQQGHDDEPGHGVEGAEDTGRDHVAAEHRHRPVTRDRDLVPSPAVQVRGDPGPSSVAVAQHEIRQQRGDDEEHERRGDAACRSRRWSRGSRSRSAATAVRPRRTPRRGGISSAALPPVMAPWTACWPDAPRAVTDSATTTVTTTQTTTLTTNDARPRVQPRRSSAATAGRNVAASVIATTIGPTTTGNCDRMPTASAITPIATRSRQLHWARRSSHPGMSPLTEILTAPLEPSTSSTAPVTRR